MANLTVSQLAELVRVNHPNAPVKIIAHQMTLGQGEFVRKSRNLIVTRTISLASQTVVGTTKASPLVLSDGTSNWSFYRDDTVPTITLSANNSVVMFYLSLWTTDDSGDIVKNYSIVIKDDGNVEFYDQNGRALLDFDADAIYLNISFIKVPSALTETSTPEIDAEFEDALVNYSISNLYPSRSDIPTIERLQLAKHYRNLFDATTFAARQKTKIQHHLIPVAGEPGDDFHSDTTL